MVIEMSMNIYAMSKSTVMPSLSAIAKILSEVLLDYSTSGGDVVAQLVECRPRDPVDSTGRGLNPIRSTR